MKSLLRAAALVLVFAAPAHAQAVLVPSPIPNLTNNCTLKWQTASSTWVCSAAAAVSQPLTDQLGLIADDADATKILAFQLSGLTTATTRTWTIPDASITFPTTIASLGTNTMTGLQTLNGGLAATTGTFSSTLGVTGLITSTGGITGGAASHTTGTFTSTLGVTGATTLSTLAATTGTFSGVVSMVGGATVTGALTMTSASTSFFRLHNTLSGNAHSTSVDEYAINFSTDDSDFTAETVLAGIGIRYQDIYGTQPNMIFRTTSTSFINAERMRIQYDGNVGIGTASPAVQFHTTGAVRFANFGAGTATFDAAGNITSVSDERLKVIQGPFTPGLNALMGIRPMRYRYTDASGLDTENVYAGFSAQNVMGYIPEAVGKNLDGLYSLNIVPVLAATVTAVQELAVEIDELRAAAKLPAKTRTATAVTGEARIVNSATPKRLAEVAKEKADREAAAKAKEIK